MKKVILASASPRRKALLKSLGLRLKVVPSNLEEAVDKNIPPERLAKKLAYKKARAVSEKIKEGIIIGADTIVILKNRIIGKPTSIKDAKRILSLLSNSTHKVITAIALIDAKTKKKLIGYKTSTVTTGKLTKKQIAYFARLHLDKAGAYAIQEDGDVLIKEIKGDFYNVVGLPVNKLKRMLKKFNIPIIRNNP